jgi:P-type Ca2+ transporter type 2C
MQKDPKGLEWLHGLTTDEVTRLGKEFGRNILTIRRINPFLAMVWGIVKEPMFLILVAACILYFILGEQSEGLMMLVAICLVTAISIFQEWRSEGALSALRAYTEPRVVVIRDGAEIEISADELVPGDVIRLEEGHKIPADAKVIQSNDLTVDESILTGESLTVDKSVDEENSLLFQGTILNTGKCYARVTHTGNQTSLGKTGTSILELTGTRTELQNQINTFVRRLALFGFFGFFTVCLINFLNHRDLIHSLLFGLSLAMSVIPEEIPVAFASFMALGAYALSKEGIITRHPEVIENLGAVTVICLDKTGTITQNKMEVKVLYDYPKDLLIEAEGLTGGQQLLSYALLASETNPFDSMEQAIIEAYGKLADPKLLQQPLPMVHEYPLSGKPPMMTHLYEEKGDTIVAAKGAIERIIQVCDLPVDAIEKINSHSRRMASSGYRVLGVASARWLKGKSFPDDQDNFDWTFEGILALYDPPKENAKEVLETLQRAGIKIKLITGDHPETAISIAKQVGLAVATEFLTGSQVLELTPAQVQEKAKTVNVFARMFPEAKLKVIEALKSNGEITAMSGDGVNDGPALRSANIGIAMGKRGTEIARQAADLILTDDNLEKIVEGVRQGRKIYTNLKKASRYIVSIHIPILLTAAVPLVLGWKFVNVFMPIHIIFLELIMGPTCSIFFEREPGEDNLLRQQPRKKGASMFGRNELLIGVIQGVVIALFALSLDYLFMNRGVAVEYLRSILFTFLILANLFLTFSDRSLADSFFVTIRIKNNLKYWILIFSIAFLCALHLIPAVRNLFGLLRISPSDFILTAGAAFVSVVWFEFYKAIRHGK